MRRRHTLGILALLIWIGLGSAAFAEWRAAIFDYDDRLAEPNTVAKYIEQQLLAAEEQITIDQYSGRGREAVAVNTLKQLDHDKEGEYSFCQLRKRAEEVFKVSLFEHALDTQNSKHITK
jgi:hypothetical protein